MSRHHQTKEWAAARAMALDRDSYRCRECGRAGRLEVHHKHSLKDGGNHELSNLISLCKFDHIEIHRAPQTPEQAEWARLLEELK